MGHVPRVAVRFQLRRARNPGVRLWWRAVAKTVIPASRSACSAAHTARASGSVAAASSGSSAARRQTPTPSGNGTSSWPETSSLLSAWRLEGNLETLAETDGVSLPVGEPIAIEATCANDDNGDAKLSMAVNGARSSAPMDDDPVGNGVSGLQPVDLSNGRADRRPLAPVLSRRCAGLRQHGATPARPGASVKSAAVRHLRLRVRIARQPAHRTRVGPVSATTDTLRTGRVSNRLFTAVRRSRRGPFPGFTPPEGRFLTWDQT